MTTSLAVFEAEIRI